MKLRLLLSLICFIATPAFAGGNTGEFSAAAPLNKGEAVVFLPKAHLLNSSEVRAGQLAAGRACRASNRPPLWSCD